LETFEKRYSMKFKVLISAPRLQPVLQDYMHIFRKNHIEVIVPKVTERLSEAELLEVMSDIDGVIAGDDKFTEKVLKSSPKLKVISKWGTGIDSFDREAAKKLGIVIRNIPGAFNDPVGDHVMAFILAFARRIPWVNDQMHAGKWDTVQCMSLTGKTLGVIGVQNTGKAVLQRARGFQMHLLGHDIAKMTNKFLKENGVTMVDKETLLKESDFISLNCNLNPSSYHLMGKEEFALMKPTAYFINAARGPLVDEPALIEALQKGHIAGAGLDVFEEEPLPANSPLLKMKNVLLSPHNANSSLDHAKRVHEMSIANLLEELKKRSV
jgi:D-3-phosphoglycerate dehydrogenase / 2-oxoglutarate reductase